MGLNLCQKATSLIIFICLASLSSIAEAQSSKPRLDFYKKIKIETGVSLKEAYEAVQGKNQFAVNMLKAYSKKVGIKEIEELFQEEIDHRTQYCRKKKSISCDETILDLKSQIAMVRDLYGKSDSLPGIQRLYLDLIIYHFNIKIKVLKSELFDWEKSCSSQEKINTRPCQEKLFEAHVLADIARDISQVALLKFQKENIEQSLLSDIKARIERYESL